jgi:phosphatidylinositol alpha-1,6-mannosyltransferase
MKIFFLTREYPPDTQWGGEAIACRDIARIFSNFGNDVHVICQSVGPTSITKDENGVTVHRVGTNPARYSIKARINYTWHAIKELLKIAKRKDDCIINGFYWGSDVFIYSIIKMLRIRSFPLILHAHGSIRDSIKATANLNNLKNNLVLKILLLIADFTARRSTKIIAISHSLQEELVKYSRIPEKTIELLLTPRDTTKYKYTPSDLKNELGIPDKRVVLAVGRLEERKGTDILCSVIPCIKQVFPDVVFLLIGNDTPTSSIKGKSYKQYLVENVLKNDKASVLFISDVTDEYLIKAYSIADVVVSPSLYETSTSVPIEAMACGKPVIVTDTGNARYMGIDGSNGLIIPPGDRESLDRAIITILNLTEEQNMEISRKNPVIINKAFSFNKWIEGLRNISDEWRK